MTAEGRLNSLTDVRERTAPVGGRKYQTDVLIVGGGPVGLSLGLDLSTRGVNFLLLEATDGRVDHPKVGSVGPRSMELFRRWGLADRIRGAGWPDDHSLDVAWVTAVGGHEIYRIHFGTIGTRPIPDYTPEPDQVCPQHWLAPLLIEALGVHPEGPIHFRWRVDRITQHDDKVVATVTALTSGDVVTVEAAYVVACDGSSSSIRKACRVDAPSRYQSKVFRNIFFRAPRLHAQLGESHALVYFLTSPSMLRYPLRSMDGDTLYRLTAPGEDGLATRSPEELLRMAIALDTPLQVLSDAPWHLTHRVADHYRVGRIFFAGDAAHTLSPSGGFGMNTGIADAADLGWKLDAVLAGWAGPHLLDSYEAERTPVAKASLEQANRNTGKTLRRELPPEIVLDNAEGTRARRALAARLEADGVHREFDAPDIHFAYRYRSALVVTDPTEDEAETWSSSALPGGRAPHAWTGSEVSIVDLFGSGFVLLSFQPSPHTERFQRAFAARRVPLTVQEVRADEVARRYGRPHVLVRPDGHVAWRGIDLPNNPDALVNLVRGGSERRPELLAVAT